MYRAVFYYCFAGSGVFSDGGMLFRFFNILKNEKSNTIFLYNLWFRPIIAQKMFWTDFILFYSALLYSCPQVNAVIINGLPIYDGYGYNNNNVGHQCILYVADN